MEFPAGQFKARCLQRMGEVEETGREVVITKRGRPVAKLVPVVAAGARDVFGCMRGTVTVVGDIVAPLEEPWEVDR